MPAAVLRGLRARADAIVAVLAPQVDAAEEGKRSERDPKAQDATPHAKQEHTCCTTECSKSIKTIAGER